MEAGENQSHMPVIMACREHLGDNKNIQQQIQRRHW